MPVERAKNMNRSIALALAMLLFLVATWSKPQAHAQVHKNFATLHDALSAVRSKYSVPTGLEISASDSGEVPVALQLQQDDLAQALNQLVEQRPEYAWSLSDGVYDLYPKTKADSVSDLMLKNYLVKDATLDKASQALNSLPEFQTWLTTRKLTRREFQTGPAWNPNQRIDLNLRDVPLRSVLNKLIKNFGLTNWIIDRYGDRKEYIAIYFRND